MTAIKRLNFQVLTDRGCVFITITVCVFFPVHSFFINFAFLALQFKEDMEKHRKTRRGAEKKGYWVRRIRKMSQG